MAKKIKITRKELLKEPDQFLSSSEKAMLFFSKNRSKVILTIVAVLIAGLSFLGYTNYQTSQIMKYEALYFNMVEIAKKKEIKVDELIKIRDQISFRSHQNRASLLLADVYFKNNEFDKAQSTFLEVINNSQGLNHQMANIGLAYIHEAKGEFSNAIDLYKSVIDANTSFPLFQVYWSLVRCHIDNNDNSNALLILREMQIKFSGTAELEKIDRRIKQLST
jgi:predicted negative regulator of RcsB-dependent stress response